MEKLNKLERLKADLKPADFNLSVVNWSDPSEEDRFYLKNYGIYNIKLRPEVYMLRLRSDGGRIDTGKLSKLANYAAEHHLGLLITARAQIELHGIVADKIWEAYNFVRDLGWEMRQSLTDNFRAIVTDPYDGLSLDSHIECMPIIEQIVQMIIGDPEWMGTIPRKFNTAIIGTETPIVNPWGNDLLLALARKSGKLGFNVYLGGKNNQTAKSADIFVAPKSAADLFIAVAKVFKKHGLRGSRSKNRLYFLIEQSGMERVRKMIEEEFGSALEEAGDLLMRESRAREYTQLKSGKYGQVLYRNGGEIDIDRLIDILGYIKDGEELRLGADQNIHLIKRYILDGSISNKSKILPQITLCAGYRYCPLSLWDIKRDISLMPLERINRVGVNIGFSGCLKGCGRHMLSDIGLVGLRTNLYGDTERAVRLYMGATQGEDAKSARLIYYSVPERKFAELMDVILDEYEASRLDSFEKFSRIILDRYSEEFLQLWFLLKVLQAADMTLADFDKESVALAYLTDRGTIDQGKLSDNIRELSHKAWDRGK